MKPRLMHVGVFILFVLFSSSLITNTIVTKTNSSKPSSNQMLNQELATTDLNRAEWTMNHFPNEGLEYWDDLHNPTRLTDTWDRSRERYQWYALAPWPVNEGSQSMGLQAKAVDPTHEADSIIGLNLYDPNTVNLTVKFDWYIDELPDPIDNDLFYLEFEIRSPGTRYLYYCLGSQDATFINGTSRTYFIIDGSVETWNTYETNVTEDYYNAYSQIPTELRELDFHLISKTQSYSRAFIDDFNLVNGTVIAGGGTLNGNFEGGGVWASGGINDPADISQSTDRVEGDWSLNATTISNGNRSDCDISFNLEKRVSSINPDEFQFWWKLETWMIPEGESYAAIYVSCSNGSGYEFDIVYMFCSAGPPVYTPEAYLQVIEVDGFNITDQWHNFNRSLWQDVTAANNTNEVIIEDVTFEFYSDGKGVLLTYLLDDCSLVSSVLNDMGYEDQGDVGDDIISWDLDSSGTQYMTVTDVAFNGNKAANLTVFDGNGENAAQDFEYRPLNNHTDTYLDLYWRLENFTELSNEVVYIEIIFDDDANFAYVLANGSPVNVGNGFEDFILVPEVNLEGEWFNLQRNIFDDYVTLLGTEPDTQIGSIYFDADSSSGGRIEILFDDFYLYNDPAPEISNIIRIPISPESGASVEVAAEVFDLSLQDVILYYRVIGSPWNTENMIEVSAGNYSATIPAQPFDWSMEYYVFANDSFRQSTSSEISTYNVDDTIPPTVGITAPSNGSTVSGTVDITVDADGTGSDIEKVEFIIDSVSVSNDTDAPYSFSWNTEAYANGEVAIIVRAYDLADNSAETLHTVTVDNAVVTTLTTITTPYTTTTTPPLETSPPPLGDTTLLAVVAGAVVGLVAIVYCTVVRPRQGSA